MSIHLPYFNMIHLYNSVIICHLIHPEKGMKGKLMKNKKNPANQKSFYRNAKDQITAQLYIIPLYHYADTNNAHTHNCFTSSEFYTGCVLFVFIENKYRKKI